MAESFKAETRKNAIETIAQLLIAREKEKFAKALEKFASDRGIDTSLDTWFFQALYCAAKEHPELVDKPKKGRPQKSRNLSGQEQLLISRFKIVCEKAKKINPLVKVTDRYVAGILAAAATKLGEHPPTVSTISNQISELRRRGFLTKK
jgi:hypothetical protein